MRSLILIAHNIRSTHNVGSLLRTADGLGVETVYLTGYTPYPLLESEDRLPHVAQKITRQINKTALGAEESVHWEHTEDIFPLLSTLHAEVYEIAALEQSVKSVKINHFTVPEKLVLIVGREVEGLEPEVLAAADVAIEIPMLGAKESFNVAQAAAMALFYARYFDT